MKVNLKAIFACILVLAATLTARAQVKYDKTFINNSVIFTLLNEGLSVYHAANEIVTDDPYHNKLVDVMSLLASANTKTLQYSVANIGYYIYKGEFGKYSPASKQKTIKLFNNDTKMYAGIVWVDKNDAKKMHRDFGSRYVLIYNAPASNTPLYYYDGREVSDSYVTIDAKGRITEYRFDDDYYVVEYNGQGNLAYIRQWSLESSNKGKGKVKNLKTIIAFTWKGDVFTKITFGWAYDAFPNEFSREYCFEPTQTNTDGLWTSAIVYHKDTNAFEGKAIDFGLVRSF